MENEYGASIDIQKSSTLSVAGTLNPLVIIKKLNFNHSIIESKDRQVKSPNKTNKNSHPRKNNFLSLNYNSTNNNPTSSSIASSSTANKNQNCENNNLLKSMRFNKLKNEQNEMINTCKEFNKISKNSSFKKVLSPLKPEKNENLEKSDIIGRVSLCQNLENRNYIFSNSENNNPYCNYAPVALNRNTIISKDNYIKKEKSEKLILRDRSTNTKSELSEINKEKEYLNSSALHLETISEKGKKKKKKKNHKNFYTNTNSNTNNSASGPAVILPKINSNANSNCINNIINNNNNGMLSSFKSDEENKNLATKDKLRKNYSQNILFRKTSESVFQSQKRSENNININKSNGNANSNNPNYNYNNYSNGLDRYTSVMKSYREKKLHLFDKNKFFYVGSLIFL